MKSWRTTLLGILGALALIAGELTNLLDSNPDTTFEFNQILAALAVFGIGAKARDNKVSSEEAGATK